MDDLSSYPLVVSRWTSFSVSFSLQLSQESPVYAIPSYLTVGPQSTGAAAAHSFVLHTSYYFNDLFGWWLVHPPHPWVESHLTSPCSQVLHSKDLCNAPSLSPLSFGIPPPPFTTKIACGGEVENHLLVLWESYESAIQPFLWKHTC